jgi:hypothetical protein
MNERILTTIPSFSLFHTHCVYSWWRLRLQLLCCDIGIRHIRGRRHCLLLLLPIRQGMKGSGGSCGRVLLLGGLCDGVPRRRRMLLGLQLLLLRRRWRCAVHNRLNRNHVGVLMNCIVKGIVMNRVKGIKRERERLLERDTLVCCWLANTIQLPT